MPELGGSGWVGEGDGVADGVWIGEGSWARLLTVWKKCGLA